MWTLTRFLDEVPSLLALLFSSSAVVFGGKGLFLQRLRTKPPLRLEGAPQAGRPAGSCSSGLREGKFSLQRPRSPCAQAPPAPHPHFPFSAHPVLTVASKPKPGSSSSKKPTGVNSPRGFSGLVWPALHVNSLFPSLLDVKILFPIISSPLPTRACAQRDAPEVLKCMLLYLDSCCAGYFPVDAGTWSSVWSAGIRGQRDRGQRGVEAQADSVPSSRSWCAASASSPRTRLHHRLSPAPSSSS